MFESALWSNAIFLRFWAGQTASRTGEQISNVAFPIIAVTVLHSSVIELGVLHAAQSAAFLVVALPAGAWVDRLSKRHALIAADAVRASALATIPVLAVLGLLHMWHLIVLGAVLSVANVFFDVSYQSYIPLLVGKEDIGAANGKLEATSQLALLGGPGLAGALISVASAPLSIIATSITYLISLICIWATPGNERRDRPAPQSRIYQEVAEGLRWVSTQPLLIRITACTAVSNFFGTSFSTLLPLLLLRDSHLSSIVLGLLFSCIGCGGVAGAATSVRIVAYIGEGPTISLSAVAFSVAALLVPLALLAPALTVWILAFQGFISGFASLLYNVTQISLRQRLTPTHLLGRMNASIRTVVWGVIPLSALLSGLLASAIGTSATLSFAAFGGALSCVPVLSRRLLTRCDSPSIV